MKAISDSERFCAHCMGPITSSDTACPSCGYGGASAASEPEPKKKSTISILGVVFLTLVGMGLLVSGFKIELSSDTVLQQTIAAIQYCTGFVLIGIALVLDAMGRIAK
jgi:predicted amidophosphoribosyltransferase